MASQAHGYTRKTRSPRICSTGTDKFQGSRLWKQVQKHKETSKPRSEWMELSPKVVQLQLMWKKKKNTLTGDFVSAMTNCCLHSSFMYLRETCILYIATLKTDSLGIYTQMTPLFLSIVWNVFFSMSCSLCFLCHYAGHSSLTQTKSQ